MKTDKDNPKGISRRDALKRMGLFMVGTVALSMPSLASCSEDKKKRIVPAKLGLLAFLAFCLCVLAWDLAQGGTDGALTAERPAVDVKIRSCSASRNW